MDNKKLIGSLLLAFLAGAFIGKTFSKGYDDGRLSACNSFLKGNAEAAMLGIVCKIKNGHLMLDAGSFGTQDLD